MARGGGAVAAVLVVAALVLALQGAMAKGQEAPDKLGQCLMDCGEKVVLCAAECGISGGGGKTECYERCGSSDVKCMDSCMGSKHRRLKTLPIDIDESDP